MGFRYPRWIWSQHNIPAGNWTEWYNIQYYNNKHINYIYILFAWLEDGKWREKGRQYLDYLICRVELRDHIPIFEGYMWGYFLCEIPFIWTYPLWGLVYEYTYTAQICPVLPLIHDLPWASRGPAYLAHQIPYFYPSGPVPSWISKVLSTSYR